MSIDKHPQHLAHAFERVGYDAGINRDPKTDLLWAKPFFESEAFEIWLDDEQQELFGAHEIMESNLLNGLEVSPSSSNHLVCCFIDGDHWKRINYDHTHDGGDDAIIGLGNELRSIFRPTDMLLRYGGDEFVALIRDIPQDLVIDLEFDLKNRLKQLDIEVQGKSIRASATLGTASCLMHRAKGDVRNAHRALKDAERNMVTAKEIRQYGAH